MVIVDKRQITGKKRKQQVQVSNTDYFAQFRGKSFPEFWKLVHPDKPLFDFQYGEYELDGRQYPGLFQVLEQFKQVWVKKATGMGFSTFVLTYIAWKSITDDNWKGTADAQVCIVTGQGIQRATDLMRRLKALFDDYQFKDKETVATIAGVRTEAFPADHIDAMRTLEHPRFIFIDEGDFFSPGQQKNARVASERYMAKGEPTILFGSTPNLPGGLFETMEKEQNSIYHKVFLPYTVGLGKIYTEESIRKAKQSPSFEREYNLKYGYGIGNIFPYQLVDEISKNYILDLKDGSKVLAVDPAYGSSKFAIVGFEQLDGGITHIKEAKQYERPSPSAMLEEVARLAKGYKIVLVDSAHPGLIRDLQDRGITAEPVMFSKELSDMTTTSAQAVKEQKVRIHTAFTELIYQLKAVEFNEKGHPDKKKLSFDLGDCFMMGTWYMKRLGSGKVVTVNMKKSQVVDPNKNNNWMFSAG